MRKIIWFLLLNVILLAASASAQTLAPIISELHGGKVLHGEFEVANNSVKPMTVVVEPKSFSVSTSGSPTYRTLDSKIHLRLSEQSAQVGARQQHPFTSDLTS